MVLTKTRPGSYSRALTGQLTSE